MPHAPAAAAFSAISMARSTELLWFAPASATTRQAPSRSGSWPSTGISTATSESFQHRADPHADPRPPPGVDRSAQARAQLAAKRAVVEQSRDHADHVLVVDDRADAEEHDAARVAQVRVRR